MNMREKMARAIADDVFDPFPWEQREQLDQQFIFRLVDAILDAMREPGMDLLCRPMENIGLCEGDIEGAWRSMIDAIKAGQ